MAFYLQSFYLIQAIQIVLWRDKKRAFLIQTFFFFTTIVKISKQYRIFLCLPYTNRCWILSCSYGCTKCSYTIHLFQWWSVMTTLVMDTLSVSTHWTQYSNRFTTLRVVFSLLADYVWYCVQNVFVGSELKMVSIEVFLVRSFKLLLEQIFPFSTEQIKDISSFNSRHNNTLRSWLFFRFDPKLKMSSWAHNVQMRGYQY